MEPQGRLVAVALQYQHKRDNDMSNCEDGEIGGRVVGPKGLEIEPAVRATAAHFQEAGEQPAFAAAWATTPPAATNGCPEIDAGRGGRRHSAQDGGWA